MAPGPRLKEFGIHDLVDVLSNANSIAHKKNKLNCRNRENSEDEYDPTNNDTDEEDLLDDDTPEQSRLVKKEFLQSHKLLEVQANVPALFDDNNHMTNELHAIAPSDGHNQMGNEDVQLVENDRRERGVNMGHGLEKMSRAMHGKLQIVIPEGGIRPVAPFAAAKFATECNIAVRNHMPVLKHWKDYKKNSALLQQFRGTLKETCQKNKNNRSNVKHHHTTGSRNYPVHVENLGDKYIDHEPDALELFKECHYSKKKKGFTLDVQLAIVKLSASREGEQSLSPTKVVADVLAEKTKKSSFLKNIGIRNACSRPSIRSIEAQLEVEKRANDDLRAVVDAQREQLDLLSKQVKETEQGRIREQDEMKKKQAEMEAKLQLVLKTS
ncbi:hypothetical protein PAHAL_3G338200 [Panicum hallii]|uniref:Uncharacterized protein n=1 Tax=Panicum hallii TaxID=206008 RepID=A0A2T8KK98_9POAL|nr:hypothetical protein PAHAL_3G338200 [Panicum hallii]